MRVPLSLLTVMALVGAMLGVPTATAGAPATGAARGGDRPAVVEMRVIGRSESGRKIYAWRVGDPEAKRTAVVMGVMHGDEAASRRLLRSIRDGRKVTGIDLWLLPTVNPDGLARGTRKNASGVDINRNFPYRWAELDGKYESGPRPKSEQETRVLIRFFNEIRPDRVVSFHQPLNGVDVSERETRPFAKRLATELNLPRKRLTCGGVCHGTFTQWYMRRHSGLAVTVEYGANPSKQRLTRRAPRQLLRALGGSR